MISFDPEISLDEVIKEYTTKALDFYNHDKKKAAAALKITDRTIYCWLNKWGLTEKYFSQQTALDLEKVVESWRRNNFSTKETAKEFGVKRSRIYHMIYRNGLLSERPALNTSKPRANEGHVVEDLNLPKGAA